MEKIQESINKDLEELKNKHTETKTTITEIKNTLEGINSRISEAERISELEDKMVEITSEELLLLSLLLVSCFCHVRLFVTPETAAHQAPLSMGFSRQGYWSGLPFPSPGDIPDPGIEPVCPALQADSLLSEPQGKSSQFSNIKIQLLLGRKLRHTDPPPQTFICQSKV